MIPHGASVSFANSNGDPLHRLTQMLQSREFPALAPAVEIVPASYFAPLDLEAIYGRNAPIEVDLGCGDGSFLVEIAAANPARDFLGIERLLGRVRRAHRKITQRELTNARLTGGDFLCCSANAASGFCRSFSFDVSRPLAQTAALAPPGRNERFSRLDSSCTCSAWRAAHRDGSNRLLSGNRTPRRSIGAICDQL